MRLRAFESAAEVDLGTPEVVNEPLSSPAGDLNLLWERRRLLYRIALWALAFGTLIALLIPAKYESTISIMPPDATSSTAGAMMAALAGKGSSELAGMATSLLGGKTDSALFVTLLGSRTVQLQIVKRFELQKVYWDRYDEDARKTLASRTAISEDRKSGVITIAVRDRKPQRAHDIAQAYVEELNRLLNQVSTSSARRERTFIEQRLVVVKSDLEDAEKRFSAFASKNTALDIKEQTKAMVDSAALLQGQIVASESELQSLEQIYTGNNVRVRALRARIDELKRQMDKVGGTDASLAEDATQPGELYPSIRKLPLLGVEWADLYRRMKIQETIYELLNQQYELARIQEAKEIQTVNIVDSANIPEKKSSPPRLLIIGVLSMFSVILGAVWIVGLDRFERMHPEDPGKQLAVKMWQQTWGHFRHWAVRKPELS